MISLLLTVALGAAPKCVHLVSTTDLHGHLTPKQVTNGQSTYEAGGLARFGAILEELRAGKDPVLLLDSGDLFQGTLESNLQHGKAVIAAFNALGYAAAAVGNHEFDFGPETMEPDATCDLQGAFKARLAEAHFPFLAVNLVELTTGELPRWPNLAASKLFDLKGLKVGVIGIANPETPSLTVRRYVESLAFVDPVEPIIREAKRLRAKGAKLVVAIGHLGGSCDVTNADVPSSCERPSQLLDLMSRLPPGTVDVMFGGHTHRFMAHVVNGTPTIEAGAEGRWFSELTACVQKGGGLDKGRLRLTPPQEIVGEKVSAPVAAIVAPYLARVSDDVRRPLGPVLAGPLRRDYHALSPLGAMVAEAVRARGTADFGIVNAGGLRADLPGGPLTYGALFETFPFENNVVVIDMSGQDLVDFVNALGGSGHGYPQVAGLSLAGDAGAYGVLGKDQAQIDLAARYRVATLDFLLRGGDGTLTVVHRFKPAQITDLGGDVSVRDAILAYLKQRR